MNSTLVRLICLTLVIQLIGTYRVFASSYCIQGTRAIVVMEIQEEQTIAKFKLPGDVQDEMIGQVYKTCKPGETISIPDDEQYVIGNVCDFSKSIVPMPYEPKLDSFTSLTAVVMCEIGNPSN